MVLADLIKIKALKSALNSIDTVKLSDVIEGFGKKEFGKYCGEYMLDISNKLAEITVEIRKRGRNAN